jgi:hypothetical protein
MRAMMGLKLMSEINAASLMLGPAEGQKKAAIIGLVNKLVEMKATVPNISPSVRRSIGEQIPGYHL